MWRSSLETELAAVLESARLHPVVSPSQMRGGSDKVTFRVITRHGPFVVQFYERTAAVVEYTLPFVAFLARRGFPTPSPHRLTDGAFVRHGRRPAAVFPLAGGIHPRVTVIVAGQMGSALATLHRTASRYPETLPSLDRLGVIRAAILVADASSSLASWSEVARAFLGETEERWTAEELQLPSKPIHHDFHAGNLLATAGVLTDVIDFDEVQRAPFIIDIARALHYFAREALDFRLPPALAASFLHGYEAIRRLETGERAALDAAYQLANLTHVAFSILDPCDRPATLDDSLRHRVYLAGSGALRPLAVSQRSTRPITVSV